MTHSLHPPFGSSRIQIAATALVLALVACPPSMAARKPPPEKTEPRAQLSIGYSLLYQEAAGIPKLKWLFMFKEKASDMGQLADNLITYYQHLADTMVKLSKQYPAMRIDLEPMSHIESETRKAIGTDQAKDMAPLAGKSGIEFEREALLMFSNALNEQRHLAGIMVGLETQPALKEFLQSTKSQLDERYTKVGSLLNRRYFTH
jgi:hypothetical protein